MNTKIRKGIAALICACMLTGCAASEGGSQQIEDNSETTARPVIEGIPAVADDNADVQKPLPPIDSIEVLGDCFIAPDSEVNPFETEIYGSYDCVPGYIYFEKETFGQIALLLDKKCKQMTPHEWYQNDEYFWTVSVDNEVLKVNKRDGTSKALFAASDNENSGIYLFAYSYVPINKDTEMCEFGRVMCFGYFDGYQDYIIILDRDTDNYDIVQCEYGLVDFWPPGTQELMSQLQTKTMGYTEAYVCEECGYTGNYVIWQNGYHEFFWYHPETGENEPVKMGNKGANGTLFVQAD